MDAARIVALQLKWSMPAVRSLLDDLEHEGVFLEYHATTGELCPQCVTHYATEHTGFCVRCTTEMELERQQEADEAEEARLREEAERAVNQVKKARERMRELYDANPRKKTLAKWIDEFVENPDRWEAVVGEVETRLREEGQCGSSI